MWKKNDLSMELVFQIWNKQWLVSFAKEEHQELFQVLPCDSTYNNCFIIY